MRKHLFLISIWLLSALMLAAQTTQLDKEKAHKLLEEANIHFDLYDFPKTFSSANEAANVYQSLGMKEEEFSALYLKTAAQLNLGYGQATQLIDSLYLKAETTFGRVHPISAKFSQLKSRLYFNLFQFDLAESLSKDVYQILKETLSETHTDLLPTLMQLTQLKLVASDFDSALYYVNKAVSVLDAHPDEPQAKAGLIYQLLASIYIRQGDYQNNLSYTLKAWESDKLFFPTQHFRIAQTLSGLAEAYFYLSQVDKARTYFIQSLKIYDKMYEGEHTTKVRALTGLGNVYNQIGNYDSALYYFKIVEKVDKLTSSSNPYASATLYANLGNTYAYLGQYVSAIENYTLAREKLDFILNGNMPNRGDTFRRYTAILLAMANTYQNMGLVSKAEETASETRRLQEESFGKKYIDLYRTLAVLGNIAFNQKEYSKALNYLQESKHILLSNTNGVQTREVADILLTTGDVYADMGNRVDTSFAQKAKSTYLESLTIYQNVSPISLVNLAQTTQRIGTAYLVLDKLDSTAYYYEKGIDLYAQAYGKDHINYQYSKLTFANLLVKQEKYVEAEEMINSALLAIKSSLNQENETMASNFNSLGSINLATKNYEKALRFYQKSLESNLIQYRAQSIYETPPNTFYVNRFYVLQSLLGRLQAFEGLYTSKPSSEILRYAHLHISLIDSLLDQEQSEINYQKDQLSFVRLASELAEKACSFAIFSEKVSSDIFEKESSFTFLEKGKARLLLSSINRSQAFEKLNMPEKLLKQNRSLNEELNFYEQKLAEFSAKNSENDQALLAEYQSTYFSLQNQKEAWQDTLEKSFPEFIRLQEQVPIVPLREVQDILGKRSAYLISYLVGDSSLYATVVSPNHYQLIRLGSAKKLETEVRLFRKGIIERDEALASNFANTLYKKLWEPLLDISLSI